VSITAWYTVAVRVDPGQGDYGGEWSTVFDREATYAEAAAELYSRPDARLFRGKGVGKLVAASKSFDPR